VAGSLGLGGLALWLGLLAVPAAAAASFVAVSDLLEGKAALLSAATSALALGFIVLESAARSNAAGPTTPPLATFALVAALLAYAVPAFAWVFEPVKVTRTKPERRRHRRTAIELEPVEIVERAA
jgi:hypothetical protein